MSTSEIALDFVPEQLTGCFAAVPCAVIRSRSLSATSKTLYMLFLSYSQDVQAGVIPVFPSREVIAEDLGVTTATLRKFVNELRSAGVIGMKRGGDGQTAYYTIQKGGQI